MGKGHPETCQWRHRCEVEL